MGRASIDKDGVDRRSKDLEPLMSAELLPLFSIEKDGHQLVPAGSLKIIGAARIEHIAANESASRYAERVPGIAVHYTLADEEGQFTADWAVVLRQGSDYIRQVLTHCGGAGSAAPVPVSAVTMIDVKAKGIEVAGRVKGSPVTVGNLFLALESPLSQCSVEGVSKEFAGWRVGHRRGRGLRRLIRR